MDEWINEWMNYDDDNNTINYKQQIGHNDGWFCLRYMNSFEKQKKNEMKKEMKKLFPSDFYPSIVILKINSQ